MLNSINRSLKNNLVLAVVILVTLIVYSKFLFFGHISWDDPEMVFKNKTVKDFDLKGMFTGHFVGNYIPLTMLLHSMAWLLFENNDPGHHLINILVHLINGILVFKLGQRLFKNETIAISGAIIFLLHPIQIESVGWIGELKNVLSATFFLAALLSYLHFITNTEKRHYFLSLLFFLLACLSKSSVVVLPLTLIGVDFLYHKKISPKFLINKIPFLLFSVFFGIINIKTQTADLFINHAHEFPYLQRVGFAGYALIKYILLFLFPVNLSVIYPYPDTKLAVFAVGYAALLTVIALIVFFILKKKYELLFVLVFIILNLILVLQFLPFGEVLYADRYLYIPILGFGWLTGILLSSMKFKTNIVFAILIFVLSLLDWSRIKAWSSAIVLYEDIIKKYPTQFIALNSAGVESMFMNEDKKALDYFDRAVSAAPRNYKGFYNRGLLFLKNNEPKLAIKSFNQAIEIYDYVKAYTGRASAYYMLGDLPKAVNDAKHALEIEKDNAKAHFVLGNCYNDLNQLDAARAEYNKSIELNKDEPDFYFKRAIVFGKQQDFNSSLSDLTVCLQLNPQYYQAYYWRGVTKINLKQNPCEDLKAAAIHNYEPAVAAFNKYCR